MDFSFYMSITIKSKPADHLINFRKSKNEISFIDQFIIKGAAIDMRYFAKSKLSRSLVHMKNFSLIRQVVFKLGYLFCQER